jgi:beta-glucanase (GH16 family)
MERIKRGLTSLLIGLCTILLPGQDWQLVWSDEFETGSLDMAKWSYQTGTGTEYGLTNWGNNELQYYLEENVVVADSVLTITAKKENVGGKQYTSGRIRTAGKGDWTCARMEFRAKMPVGKGMWTAIWMMPTDNAYGGWAASGEIDLMEHLGDNTKKVYGTLHFGGTWPNHVSKGSSYMLSSGDYHDEFHVFVVEWEEREMRWYVDGHLYQTLGEDAWYSSGAPFPAPFDKRFHLLINLAVGGNWPGSPDASTTFPQEVVVDYVRIYQKPATGIGREAVTGTYGFSLYQNVPNPFGPSTRISYSTREHDHLTLELYDALGRKVETLVDEMHSPGDYSVEMDGSLLPPGLYTCRLSAGSHTGSIQMLLQ